MNLLIGLDVGTSAVKGILVSAEGEKIALAKRPTSFLHPRPGWVELDPEEHYRSVCGLIRELAAEAPKEAYVRALAMSAASGNPLLTDGDGRPLTNIIGWLDTRCRGHGAELLPGFQAEAVQTVTGWPFGEFFPLMQLAWLRRHLPEAWGKAAHVAMNTDWLLYRLTGRWGIDPSTATTFYLYDQARRDWYRPYLDFLGISGEQLPMLGESGQVLSPLSPQGAEDTGLTRDTLAVLGCFDHPGAARGTGILSIGDLLLSCGTSWVGFYPVDGRERAVAQRQLVDPFLSPRGPWGCMFSLAAIGVIIEKHIDSFIVREGEEAERKFEIFNAIAARVPRGAEGLYVDLYKGRGTFMEEVDSRLAAYPRERLARAVMESAVFEMRREIEKMAAAGIGAGGRIVMVGGPSESPIWPKIVAEVLGRRILLLNGQTAGAMGAAVLAAIGAGLYRDERQAFRAMDGQGTAVLPKKQAVAEYEDLYQRYLQEVKRDQA